MLGGIATLPNGLTSIYGYNLADRVDYRNSRTARGIIVSVHYVLTFDIKNQ